MIFQPGDIINNLRIEQYLGRGAFGEVYHAIDLTMNRPCAVKFVLNLNPSAFDAHKEGQLLYLCRHARVVEVFDVQALQHGGNAYAAIEMEFFPEGSLESYLQSNYVTAREAIRWSIDILFALEHSHSNGVLHRDIKPGNIMLSKGMAKLSDYGLATVVAKGQLGSGAGTPLYAAPELIQQSQTSIATDIYSVGMTLFELLNNVRIWRDSVLISKVIANGSLIKKHGYHEIIPNKLRRICNMACHQTPEKRYLSAKAMRQALESIKVNLDWKLINDDTWEARQGTKIHALTIEERKGQFETVYKTNNRRDNQRCTISNNKNAARQELYDKISKSLLKA